MCQREEEERKEEERRRAVEERRRLERERILKERRDAEERDRKMNEKLQMIEEQRLEFFHFFFRFLSVVLSSGCILYGLEEQTIHAHNKRTVLWTMVFG